TSNVKADILAKLASGNIFTRKVMIKTKEKLSIEEVEVMKITGSFKVEESWKDPIVQCIRDKIVPDNKVKAQSIGNDQCQGCGHPLIREYPVSVRLSKQTEAVFKLLSLLLHHQQLLANTRKLSLCHCLNHLCYFPLALAHYDAAVTTSTVNSLVCRRLASASSLKEDGRDALEST
ncbi:hypothetical protein ACLOJK_037250, partial [Asimina triloba]